MQISELPSEDFRSDLLLLMAADLVIAVGWERLCRHTFRKQPNPLVPVTKPPEDIIKKAKQKQRQKAIDAAKKAKAAGAKNSPWQMMKDMSKHTQQAQQQMQQQQQHARRR